MQERFRYFHGLCRVAAKLVRLGLTDCDDAIRRQVVRRGEFKRHLAGGVSFQARLPIRERNEILFGHFLCL